MANDKVFSVRADDATIAQLDKIAEESGLKKAEILPVLLTSYATAQAKSILPGRATEIENVGNLLDQIKTAYLASLELNANAEERIRAEFIARIENNEQAMSSLKEKADAAMADAKDAKSALADLTKERDALAKRAEAAENELAKEREAAAEEKDRLVKFNESLQAQVEALKEKAEAATAELQAAAALEEESAKAKSELQAAIQRAEKAEAEAAELSKKLTDATEKAKTDATVLKGRYDEKFDNLREKLKNEKQSAILDERRTGEAQLRAAVDAADEKHQGRIDKMQAAIDKLTEQRDQWQEKFYALREEQKGSEQAETPEG
jgi:DNA repair exonuclease SbcCD ATPase subunit